MAIHVRLEGELPPVWLPVVPEDSVATAREDAADLWEKEIDACRLFFDGRELDDPEKTLADYGVGLDDLLVMTAKS